MKHFTLTILIYFISSHISASNSRYRLILTGNPSSSITIAWDQTSGNNPVLYFGTKDGGKKISNYPQKKTPDRVKEYGGMNNHFVNLTKLQSNTNYYFIIKDNEGISERFWFKTAPSTNKSMSFISGGDSRNNRAPRIEANKLVAKLKPTAVFFGGDMTNSGSNTEWVEWMDDWQHTTSKDGRMFPILPARGNHERSNNSVYNLFNTPSKDIYYNIVFGRNLFSTYTLNSEIAAGGNQYTWLKDKLAKDNSSWKYVQYHKPMRPHQSHKEEGNDEYNNWATLFYHYRVDLVSESDSHVVKTTFPIKPCKKAEACEEGFIRDDNSGTIYVGEGCWGAPLRANDDDKTWTRKSGSFNQFKWITVSKKEIKLQTIIVDEASGISENSNNAEAGKLPLGISVWESREEDIIVIK
ncbi:fibronectin type III domain-containing protein [Salegentibacter sp. Hel_I_6]|uniref:fibronectin type III domain-containing protein n=1 Tax=Salegentibacter sp. Hel_I_6 TaxID=1250278 RepID=UPI00068FB916|nr:fibronectin type III domain-containing protein [Salegentibacter sp. Hel_I_6]